VTGDAVRREAPDFIKHWAVAEQGGRLYFEYHGHTIGNFSGSRENAEYMVCLINHALAVQNLSASVVDWSQQWA